jgi:hypothetical protein
LDLYFKKFKRAANVVAMKEIKNQIYAPQYIFSYSHQNWSEEVLDNFHPFVP